MKRTRVDAVVRLDHGFHQAQGIIHAVYFAEPRDEGVVRALPREAMVEMS